MTVDEIAEELKGSVAVSSGDVAALFDLLIEHYANQRLDTVDIEKDGDMLLFQWGSYGHGSERYFTVELKRQTTLDLPDPDDSADSMRQLHAVAIYPPSEETEHIGKGNSWCTTPLVISEFLAFVKGSPAYQWATRNPLASLQVTLESV